MANYEIVQNTDAGLTVLTLTEENLFPALEIRGFKYTGPTKNQKLRAELQNQPTFDGLVGPMYGGPGVVRYEDWKAYDKLST